MPSRTFPRAVPALSLPSRIALSLRDAGDQDTDRLVANTGLGRGEVALALRELAVTEVVEPVDPSAVAGDGPVYRFRGEQAVVAALDIGPHTVRRMLCDLDGRVLFTDSRPGAARAPLLDRVGAMAAMVVADLARAGVDRSRLWAVTLGLPARIGADGRVLDSSLLPGWNGVDLAGRLSEALDCAVHLANDMTLAATAEATLDCGSLATDFLAVQVGRRLGLRQVIGGRPYEGASRTAGSVAHLFGERVEANGDLVWGLDEDGERVVALALAGDPDAAAEVAEVVHGLAGGIAHGILLANPETVVLGGGIGSRLGPWREDLSRQVRQQLRGVAAQVNIHCSRLGSDAVLAGACLLALEEASGALFGEAVPPPAPDSWAALAG